MNNILIIGAGAAGLMAADILSRAGRKITVIEAGAQPGGRMRTAQLPGFTMPAETGAEFVHGELPVTLELLKAESIGTHPVGGKMMRVRNGKWIAQDFFSEDWEKLMQQMGKLKTDMPIGRFLTTYFSDEKYELLRTTVRGFAEGYDLADLDRASTKGLYEEWKEEGEETEFRIDGGYRRMVDALVRRIGSQGGEVICGSAVSQVEWSGKGLSRDARSSGHVRVQCTNGRSFSGDAVLITVSLGVLQAGMLRFTPDIPAHRDAFAAMGFGSVIKVLAEFRSAFWAAKAEGIGFFLSDEAAPTWWTQYPSDQPLLTGWIAGAAMQQFQALSDEGRLEACVESLAAILGVDAEFVRGQLVAFSVHDWSRDSFVRGGYSYETVGSTAARSVVTAPVEGTLFFAGEALYVGRSTATVEAALVSGRDTAKKMLAG